MEVEVERGIVQSSAHERTKNSLKPQSCVKMDFLILWTLAWCKRNAVDTASPQQSCPSADISLVIAVSFLYLACGYVSSVGMMQAGCTQSTTIGHCLREIWLSRNRRWLGGNRRRNMEGAIALNGQ